MVAPITQTQVFADEKTETAEVPAPAEEKVSEKAEEKAPEVTAPVPAEDKVTEKTEENIPKAEVTDHDNGITYVNLQVSVVASQAPNGVDYQQAPDNARTHDMFTDEEISKIVQDKYSFNDARVEALPHSIKLEQSAYVSAPPKVEYEGKVYNYVDTYVEYIDKYLGEHPERNFTTNKPLELQYADLMGGTFLHHSYKLATANTESKDPDTKPEDNKTEGNQTPEVTPTPDKESNTNDSEENASEIVHPMTNNTKDEGELKNTPTSAKQKAGEEVVRAKTTPQQAQTTLPQTGSEGNGVVAILGVTLFTVGIFALKKKEDNR